MITGDMLKPGATVIVPMLDDVGGGFRVQRERFLEAVLSIEAEAIRLILRCVAEVPLAEDARSIAERRVHIGQRNFFRG